MAVVNPFVSINSSLPPLMPNPDDQPMLLRAFQPNGPNSAASPAQTTTHSRKVPDAASQVFANLSSPRDQPPSFVSMPGQSDSDALVTLQKVPSAARTQVWAPTPQDKEASMLNRRLDQDYAKDLHPWGTPDNHPGVWGKIAHDLSVATGGPNRRLMEEERLGGWLNNVEQQESENELRHAQAGEAGARTHLTEEQAENEPQRWREQANTQLAEHGLRMDDSGTIAPIPESELSPLEEAQVQAARNPWMKEAGNEPIGGRVSQLNQAMLGRYQVLHPDAKALPEAYMLPANATKNDFDRLDKLMQAEETASANQQNRAESDRMRQAMLALATQREQNSNQTQGSKWVTWTDANGNTVAGPRSEAEAAGASDVADLQGQEIRDVQNARHTYQLITKQGDAKNPETQGVLQLIDSLDKDGKLGVLASRYNRFVTQGIGASPGDDPRIITLIDKGMLADTGTMLAHFGASGGRSPAMLQHFLDLANTGKMDGVTLRSGYKAIADYMKDRGMIPVAQGRSGGASQGGQQWEVTATGKDGHRIGYRGGKWYDTKTGREYTGASH